MIAALCSWLMPAARQSRRRRPTAVPLAEALETRTVLSVSITANIGGVLPAVVSVTLPQPTRVGAQEVSLILRPSAALQQLARDAALGKTLHNVSITLSDGENGQDTIDFTRAVIASFRLIAGPASDEPLAAVTLQGLTGQPGSISADIGGARPHVISLTIPQTATSSGQDVSPQHISLVAKVSPGVSELFQDADSGKVIPEVDFTLDQVGNGSIETISLTGVFISSIQFVGTGDIPEVDITLVSRQATIKNS